MASRRLSVNRKRTIGVPRVTRIRTEKEADDESNVCDCAGYAAVVDLGQRLVSLISEDFEGLRALQLSRDSHANCDTYTITESLSEHDANPGA